MILKMNEISRRFVFPLSPTHRGCERARRRGVRAAEVLSGRQRMGGFKDSKANPQNWENPFKRSKRSKAGKAAAEEGGETAGEGAKKSKKDKWTYKLNPKHWFA